MFLLPAPVEETYSIQQGDEAHVSNQHDPFSLDGLLGTLAGKKDETEGREKEGKEKEGKEKEGRVEEELEGRRRWEEGTAFFYQAFHASEDAFMFIAQQEYNINLHRASDGYRSHHAAISQKAYLYMHALKLPC